MTRQELTPQDNYGAEWLEFLLARTQKAISDLIKDTTETYQGYDFPTTPSAIRNWQARLGSHTIEEIMKEVEINIGNRDEYIQLCLALESDELTPYRIWLEQQIIIAEFGKDN